MAMNKIDGSNPYPPSVVDKFKNARTPEEADKSVAGADGESARSRPNGEKAEISAAAHDLMDLRQAVDTGRTALESLPDIRLDKVEQARTRLAQGYYNSVEVRDEVAVKLNKVISDMDQL